MSLNLSDYHLTEHQKCLAARDIARHADLVVVEYLCDDRQVVAYLLSIAADLMTASQELIRLFREDGYDHDTDTSGDGLTQAQRHHVMTLAVTCAYNATLFVQEAQRRPITRANAGWDPITNPITKPITD